MSASLFALGENGILDLVAANFRAPAYRSSQCLYLPLHTLPLREGRACNYLSILHSGLALGVGPAAAGVWRIMSAYIHIYIYIEIYLPTSDTQSSAGLDSAFDSTASWLLAACQTGSFKAALPASFKGFKFSLSRSLLPEVGQCCYPPAPPSLPPPSLLHSRHFSAAISQLGESREGRLEALPCLPLRVCAHMQTGKKKGGTKKIVKAGVRLLTLTSHPPQIC